MDYLYKKNKDHKLPFVFHELGSWWGNNPIKKCEEEIDLVAGDKSSLIVGECKWQNQVKLD